MLHNFGKRSILLQRLSTIVDYVRFMTSTEVSTALRPFYFSVHPDLFGKYPIQRSINEGSLKQLSLLMETLQLRRSIKPSSLQFYIRDKSLNASSLKLVKIFLHKNDIREAVLTILKSCDLSTEYVDKLTKPASTWQKKNLGHKDVHVTYDADSQMEDFQISIKKARNSLNLLNWLEKNHNAALQLTRSYEPLREEVARLLKSMTKQFDLKEIQWDCGWNDNHIRGCLQSLKAMVDQNPEALIKLKGRVLVFAPFTGVNLEGHIMLNSGEVRHNWLDFVKNVNKYDKAFLRIPAFEKAVSQVLRDIQVVRRKFMPKILVDEYEMNLTQFTTNIGDYLSRKSYPKNWPSSLKDYEIVIETEAGPLMVSPTGQFIVPSSCPGFLLVNFLSLNMDLAANRIITYKKDKYIERSLHAECIKEFQLLALRKDDNVTPDLMIKCCKRLIESRNNLVHLHGVMLNITNYYSVLGDGTVCIPWNWSL